VVVNGITIGRDPKCDLIVDDPYVSLVHAKVTISDGQLYIEDLGSINGTWVNEVKVWEPFPIAHGATVRVGFTKWMVHDLLEKIRNRFEVA
jgi:pSer/pThr/pTyr-binding forkhead associated (FHA) protein